jgi:hypothetical protein
MRQAVPADSAQQNDRRDGEDNKDEERKDATHTGTMGPHRSVVA